MKIGDRVANKHPENISYGWHGTIVRRHKENPDTVVWVDWQERKAKDSNGRSLFKSSIVTSKLEDLRIIERYA